MVETNAILAINSLDRYNTNKVVTTVYGGVGWQGVGLTVLDYVQSLNTEVPPVGSILVAAVGPAAGGLTLGTKILAITPRPGYYEITIDIPTVADGSAGAETWWDFTEIYKFPTINNSLKELYDSTSNAPSEPPSNNFTIQSAGSLIYGYITKIVVAQIQVQYNVPTVNRYLNDTIYIADWATKTWHAVTIFHGFYYADELAAVLQIAIRAIGGVWTNMQVVFDPRDGFIFTDTTAPTPLDFYFPSYEELEQGEFPATAPLPSNVVLNVLKTSRLLGLSLPNSRTGGAKSRQISYTYPNFLYTPYIDFYSDVLTNYQKVKDTNTSIKSPKGLIGRVYLSGVGGIQTNGAVADTGRSVGLLGTQPFVMTSDLNFPKVIRWTPDQTVTSIDIQVRDCYGDLLPGFDQGSSTEFQMTLLCTEGDT